MDFQRTALQQGEQAGLSYRFAPPRNALRGAAGFHAGSQQGVSLDFSDYREYHPGDDVRSLDWSVYARTDKLTLKLYHEEVSPHVDILLDASQSMALGDAKPKALLGLGALMATAAANGDCSANAFLLGEEFQPLERGHGLPSGWGTVEFAAQNNPGAQLHAGAGYLKRQSVRVLISDLLWDTEPITVLRRISESASRVIVVQLLSREDTLPPEQGKYRLEDAETGGSMEIFIDSDAKRRYLQALETHTQLWSEACRSTGALHCRLIAEELLDGWRLDPLLRTGVLEHQGGQGMLTNPIALIGLAAIPALLTVYLLRNRVKHRTVSSLMLWMERSRMTTGGGWIQRNRLPLLFFLELLIILLLIWAAANPLRLSRETARPVVVVLDNSASMAAIGADGLNAAQRALKQLPKLVRQERFSPVRIIVAGNEPRWLGSEATQSLLQGKTSKDWNLQAAAFQVEKALLLARENSTPDTKLLIISDARPEQVPTSGNLRWQAFGTPLSNAGFVNAVRSDERCMVEIYGTGTTELELTMDGQTQTVSIELPARKIYKLAHRSSSFEAALPADALAIDNRIQLLPKPETRIRVGQSINHPELRELVARSVAATGFEADGAPELLITDTAVTPTNLNTWLLHLVPAEDASPFTGPFVVDHESQLLAGLSFEGLVWAGSESNALPGMPVVMAGNVPLLTRQDDLSGRPTFYLQIDPALSTLQHSPVWPTLFWNLLQARAALQPGFKEVNLRPGMPFEGTMPDEPGIIEQELDGQVFRAIYNFMDAEESNLSGRGSGDDGSWMKAESVEREYAELAPPIVLAAIALLALHQFLLRRQSGVTE